MATRVTPGQRSDIETEYRSETLHRSDDSRRIQSPAGTVLFSMNQVSVQYDGTATPVLNAVSFTIRSGETVLLAGPSGCGKSTLALLCAGLIPDSVEAVVEGQVEVHPSLAAPGGRAMVFQDPTTQFCMPKIADEIAFGLENQSVSPEEMPSQIAEAMLRTRFTIPPSREHHQLSGGQQQKLAIASALAVRPELLILDEPTSNLDPESTQLVFDEVAQLRAAGQTMLIVEHKFQPLLEVVDRVVLFGRDGQIYHEGPPHEVLRDAFAWMVEEGIISDDAARVVDDAVANQPPSRLHPAIQVTGATVKRGDNVVWSHLDIAIPYGQLTAIVGPNGAGKSTLLQAMCGLHPLTSGEIELLGKPLPKWNKSERMKTVSYCFQNPELQFVYERVADEFANEMVSDPIPAELETQLANFGLKGTAQQSPFALSQGQKRRLSVAVMLHDEHEIYLLDEPTYGQDVKTQKAIMDMMVGLVHAGKTVVLTTHDMNLVRKYASNVVVIADGACLYSGAPGGLFERHDLLSRAHLKDIQAPLQVTSVPSGMESESLNHSEREVAQVQQRMIRRPTDRLNPAWLVVAMVVGGLLGTFAHNFTQALVALAVALVWVFVIARIRVTFALKWYAWFAMIYAFYIWSFAAYAAVPPGYAHFRVGWMNFSWFGMREGLLMAVKMFSSVGYLVVMTGSLDLTNLIVALSRNMRVPPKFAFGILAGLRLAPLLRAEWGQLKLARQLRGKDSRFAMTRPVRYAIPLLSQGVRMSERVAVAMEARGLIGEAARSATGRTYFREMDVHAYDVVVTCIAILIPAAILIFVR